MWRFAICLTAGLMILACSKDKEPTAPDDPPTNTGTTSKSADDIGNRSGQEQRRLAAEIQKE